MVEREIRDRLTGKDPLEVNVVYLTAIAEEDRSTVRAIENAPKAFALITPDQRETGDAMKLERSPLAPQVTAADAIAFIYQSVSAAVHAELGMLVERYGVDVQG